MIKAPKGNWHVGRKKKQAALRKMIDAQQSAPRADQRAINAEHRASGQQALAQTILDRISNRIIMDEKLRTASRMSEAEVTGD